jgi:hypothetical protein
VVFFYTFEIMKNIFITIFIVIFCFSSKAQVIIPAEHAHVEITSGAHIKDTNFFLDNFIGTWQFTQGNKSFTIILNKSLDADYDSYFKDILYGEYQYVDDSGTTLVNTLPLMNTSYSSQLSHNISGGNFIRPLEYPKCLACSPNELRVQVYFEDPERRYIPMEMVLRSISPTQIQVKLYQMGQKASFVTNSIYDEIRVPAGEYIMNKI